VTPPSWVRQLFARTPRTVRQARARHRPRLEGLEERCVPSTVTNLSDHDPGSLRDAIASTPSGGTVTFQPGLTGTIMLTTGELALTKDLTIAGPGASVITVSGNSASRVFELSAGGTHNFTFSGLTIANGSTDFGGGMDFGFTSGTLTIQDCVFSGNSASQTGGGLEVAGNGASATTVNVSNTTFTNNQGAFGAAAEFFNSTATLTNCTISGNTASTNEVLGVDATGSGQTANMTLRNCTIAGNSAPLSVLAVFSVNGAASATASYGNTIFANSASGSQNVGAFGAGASVTSLGHNISDDGTGNLTAAGDQPNTKPLLAPLGNYGGPEPTMALLPGSPAIDAGTSSGAPAQDQRGVNRVGAVDIGAFESRGFTMTIAGGNSQRAFVNTAFAAPLSVQVTSAFGEPVQGGVVTFSAPGSGASAGFPGGTTAVLDASGTASLSVTANGTAGSYSVSAAASGSSSATFSLTNLGLAVQQGQTAGIGFWHNKNGQALITSFNGGSSSTALSAWLAATFPNLYGVSAGANNLTGMTNAQVADFYLTQFALHGPKVEAETLAVALNVYATTLSLGGTAGAAYGFTVSTTGLGEQSFNVGADGAAFGVANNTTLNVIELLEAVNQQAAGGVLYSGDAALRQQANDLFDALNQAGSIG
jgi:hypothetical protein